MVAAFAQAGSSIEKVVPESYVSRAWTVKTSTNVEMRVTFWRPDVFRIEAGPLVADTNVTVKTEISATGQYITTTNSAFVASYADPKNDPAKTQMLVDGAAEDMTRVRFADGDGEYVWETSALKLKLDKGAGTFECRLPTGETVFRQTRPVALIKSQSTNETDDTILYLASNSKARYFGGGQQNADYSYVETTTDVVARNAEKYRAEDMPCGWLLVNDGYGCKYMQLGWTVEALKSLGFRTGLWTEGVLDRINWEIGKAGTRIQKIDVAWSGPAYQHGLECNRTAYDGFINNSDARAFIWTCQGWAGTQRYGVCWTGDQYGNLDLVRYRSQGCRNLPPDDRHRQGDLRARRTEGQRCAAAGCGEHTVGCDGADLQRQARGRGAPFSGRLEGYQARQVSRLRRCA